MKAFAAAVATVLTVCSLWAGGWAIKAELEAGMPANVEDGGDRP